MADNGNGSDVRLSMRLVVGGIALLISLGGAGWTVMDTRFNAVRERQDVYEASVNRTITSNVGNVRDAFASVQVQLDRRLAESLRTDESAAKRMDAIQGELDRRLTEFVTIRQFNEFEKLVSAVREQIKVIETTRPMTGELQTVSKNTSEQLSKLEERVRALENNLRK